MLKTTLSDQEKKDLIKNILGAKYSSAGNHFPIMREMMDGLSTFNNTATFAELIPVLNTWLSGSAVTAAVSTASFAGTILFPFQQIINLINANENGLRLYSYRAISYAITTWSFDKPKPISSPRVISNLTAPPYGATKDIAEYHEVWKEALIQVLTHLEFTCIQKNIKKQHLKTIFKALGHGSPEKLSVMLLKGFEKNMGHTSKNMWISGYKIAYPR